MNQSSEGESVGQQEILGVRPAFLTLLGKDKQDLIFLSHHKIL